MPEISTAEEPAIALRRVETDDDIAAVFRLVATIWPVCYRGILSDEQIQRLGQDFSFDDTGAPGSGCVSRTSNTYLRRPKWLCGSGSAMACASGRRLRFIRVDHTSFAAHAVASGSCA